MVREWTGKRLKDISYNSPKTVPTSFSKGFYGYDTSKSLCYDKITSARALQSQKLKRTERKFHVRSRKIFNCNKNLDKLQKKHLFSHPYLTIISTTTFNVIIVIFKFNKTYFRQILKIFPSETNTPFTKSKQTTAEEILIIFNLNKSLDGFNFLGFHNNAILVPLFNQNFKLVFL